MNTTDDQLWLPSEVASFLRVSTRQVAERYAMREDFPRPIRLPSDTRTKPRMRWYKSQIIDWLNKCQSVN